MPLHLHIIYGCFGKGELSTCNRDWPAKPEIFIRLVFTEKVCQPWSNHKLGEKSF